MDPDATLADIRWTIREYREGNLDIYMDDLIALIDDLDNWLSRGGFKPKAWETK